MESLFLKMGELVEWVKGNKRKSTEEIDNVSELIFVALLCFGCLTVVMCNLIWINLEGHNPTLSFLRKFFLILEYLCLVPLCWKNNPLSRYLCRFCSKEIWSNGLFKAIPFQMIIFLIAGVFALTGYYYLSIYFLSLAIFLGILFIATIVYRNLKLR